MVFLPCFLFELSPLKNFLWLSLGSNQYRAGRVYDMCILWREHRKAQPKVVLKKPGIEPATPGLQGIVLILYTTTASSLNEHNKRKPCKLHNFIMSKRCEMCKNDYSVLLYIRVSYHEHILTVPYFTPISLEIL